MIGDNSDDRDISGGDDEDGDGDEDGCDQSWNDYPGGGDVVQCGQEALRHHLTNILQECVKVSQKRFSSLKRNEKHPYWRKWQKSYIGSPP